MHAIPPRSRPQLPRLPQDQLIYHGQRLDLVLRPVATRAGTILQREVCLHPGAVIVLGVVPDGRIVMIRNRRHTVGEELLELPAGTLDRDPAGQPEDPALCAARELTEETGYTAAQLVPFGWFYTSPGILSEKMHAFLATGLTPGAQKLEESEQIQVVLMSREEVLRLIRENRIVDAKTIATVLRYILDA